MLKYDASIPNNGNMVWTAAEKLTAIVIDDDKEFTRVMSEYLKLVSIDVVGCGYDGKEAVELFEKFNPDLVFLDYNMPQYDGSYALFQIRKLSPIAHVIIVTADDTLETNSKIESLNPDFIVQKPLNMTDILKMVQKLEPDKAKSIQILDG